MKRQITNDMQNNMSYLFIGTTAINRPSLHSQNIKEWREWINKLDTNKYNIKWFINIDIIENLDVSYEETEKNLKNIIKPLNETTNEEDNSNIELFFIKNPKNSGNFLKACQRVSDKIKKYVKNNDEITEHNSFVMWLEDDWKLSPSITIPLQYIIETYLFHESQILINLTYIRNNYIHALAPSISKYKLWKKLFYDAWYVQKRHIDPEHCVGLYYNKTLKQTYENTWNFTIITKHKKMTSKLFNKIKNAPPLNYINSYYTYDEYDDVSKEKNNKDVYVDDRYIPKINIKQFLEEKDILKTQMIFMRISASFCPAGVDYGRKFMKDNNLVKNRKQTDKQIDFYS